MPLDTIKIVDCHRPPATRATEKRRFPERLENEREGAGHDAPTSASIVSPRSWGLLALVAMCRKAEAEIERGRMSMLVEIGAPPDSGPEIGYLTDDGWRKEAALEIWVNTDTRPVTIRLCGVLDQSTALSVGSIIEELLDGGYRDLLVQIGQLEIPDINVLMDIERIMTTTGGSLCWSM